MRKQSPRFTKLVLTAFVLLFSLSVAGQKNRLSVNEYNRWKKYALKNDMYVSAYFGHGSYSMRNMSYMQRDLINDIGIDARINSDFPPYWLYGVSIARKYDDIRFGMNLENMSTGARSSLSDYSGQFYSDIVCKALKLGVFLEKDKWPLFRSKDKIMGGYRIEGGGLYNDIYIHQYAVLYDLLNGTVNQEIQLMSSTFYVEPALYASFGLGKQTYVQLSLGYMLNIPLEINIYTETARKDYNVDWAGYRLRLAIVHQL